MEAEKTKVITMENLSVIVGRLQIYSEQDNIESEQALSSNSCKILINGLPVYNAKKLVLTLDLDQVVTAEITLAV